jgi:hypothetical protein
MVVFSVAYRLWLFVRPGFHLFPSLVLLLLDVLAAWRSAVLDQGPTQCVNAAAPALAMPARREDPEEPELGDCPVADEEHSPRQIELWANNRCRSYPKVQCSRAGKRAENPAMTNASPSNLVIDEAFSKLAAGSG